MSEINQAQNEQQELQLENLRFELHKGRAKLQQEWAKLKTQEAEFNQANPKFPFNMQDYSKFDKYGESYFEKMQRDIGKAQEEDQELKLEQFRFLQHKERLGRQKAWDRLRQEKEEFKQQQEKPKNFSNNYKKEDFEQNTAKKENLNMTENEIAKARQEMERMHLEGQKKKQGSSQNDQSWQASTNPCFPEKTYSNFLDKNPTGSFNEFKEYQGQQFDKVPKYFDTDPGLSTSTLVKEFENAAKLKQVLEDQIFNEQMQKAQHEADQNATVLDFLAAQNARNQERHRWSMRHWY
uniref:Uncharacterized protein n=1 Tax=Acrobeloides nanus TaxID=290746 RepID=A0A914DFF0_9BILA